MSKSTRRPPKLSAALFSTAVGAGAPTGGLPPSPSAQNPTEVHDAHVELASRKHFSNQSIHSIHMTVLSGRVGSVEDRRRRRVWPQDQVGCACSACKRGLE